FVNSTWHTLELLSLEETKCTSFPSTTSYLRKYLSFVTATHALFSARQRSSIVGSVDAAPNADLLQYSKRPVPALRNVIIPCTRWRLLTSNVISFLGRLPSDKSCFPRILIPRLSTPGR